MSEIEFKARKPRVTGRVVHDADGVVWPDMQAVALGSFRNGKWEPVILDPEDLMYVGPDMHNKGDDDDCLSTKPWPVSGIYWCTPCAINEGAAVGIEYPPGVRGEAKTLSFRRAKASAARVCELKAAQA